MSNRYADTEDRMSADDLGDFSNRLDDMAKQIADDMEDVKNGVSPQATNDFQVSAPTGALPTLE